MFQVHISHAVFAAVVDSVFDCLHSCISDCFVLADPAVQSHQHQQCSDTHAERCGLHAYRLSSSCSRCAAPVRDRRQSWQACSVALRLQSRTRQLPRLKPTGLLQPQAFAFAWLAGSSPLLAVASHRSGLSVNNRQRCCLLYPSALHSC